MKVTYGKYYYDIIPYPHIEVVHSKDGECVRITCDKYPDCDNCNSKFRCYTEATEIGLSFYRPFVEKMPCLVVPSLSEEAVLALNIVLNSKRKNLSEPEQREAFTRLINIGWSVEQVANSSNFSAKRVKNQVMIEESASQEVKDAIDSKEFSARKVDESFMGLVEAHYQSKGDKDINGIPKDINQAIQTEVAKYINILNANRQPDEEEITRDWMFQHRTDETVLINSKVMWKDYTPEQIARSSVIKTDEANFICEHPDKVDVMGKTKVWFKYSRK